MHSVGNVYIYNPKPIYQLIITSGGKVIGEEGAGKPAIRGTVV
jgi:hypothetical protein